MIKPVIALDLDDTVWEFNNPLIAKYNLRYDDRVSIDDFTSWDITPFIKIPRNEFYGLATEGFFEEDVHIDYAVANRLERINKRSELFFVTAGCAKTIPWRYESLKRHLPWIRDEQIVKLADKQRFDCDLLVDDNTDNCNNAYRYSYLISRPWNLSDEINVSKVKRCDDIVCALDNISDFL